MEHLSNHVICENKRNRYKEVLNKAALDKSKEIVAEEIASWSAANWMESKYPYLTRKEAEAIGKNLVKKASPFVAGASSYLYGIQENHERFKSPYNAFSADAYDTLPISLGIIGAWWGSALGGPVGGAVLGGTISIGASVWGKIEKDKKR